MNPIAIRKDTPSMPAGDLVAVVTTPHPDSDHEHIVLGIVAWEGGAITTVELHEIFTAASWEQRQRRRAA